MTTPRRDRKRKGNPEWVRLGELLAGRRADLSPDYEGHGGRAAFARDRAVNLKLIQDIELNARENFTPKTLRDVIAPAYSVTYESIRRALGGGELEPLAAPAAAVSLPSPRVTPGSDWVPPMDGEAPGVGREQDPIMTRLAWLALRDIPADEATEEAVEAYLAAPATLPGTEVFPDAPADARFWDDLAEEGLSALQIARVVARVRNSQARNAARPGSGSSSALVPAVTILTATSLSAVRGA